ncbi:VOC family protein [Patulibacter defluvii]|uniref:VOC family protein n=1 Tax=Patulibacter defluvii TaxID=3095358 RepID=UPI002A75014C|nr:VOC family protein [Patulibacter sp. DM4]
MSHAHLHGGIAHVDIAGPDLTALAGFYGPTLGWDVQSRGPGYSGITTPAGSADGALVEADEPSITIGVTVDDLDATVAAAVAHGGALAMPPTDNGWVVKAQVRDPAGNLLTLIQR